MEIASRCGARVVNVSVRGYGAALYGAIMATRKNARHCGAEFGREVSILNPEINKRN